MTATDEFDPVSQRIVMLGAGNMGGAVAHAVRAAGVPREQLLVLNSSEESSARAAGEVEATSAFEAAGTSQYREALGAALEGASVLILGIKPYQLASVLPALSAQLSEDTLVVSLAAGATLETLRSHLGGHDAIIRVMPNTPIAVGRGVAALMASEDVTQEQIALVTRLLADSATVLTVPESQVHAVIGAAGSAPAFFFLIAEAMIDEAVAQGLTRAVATELVTQTMLGSAELLTSRGTLPAEARYAVTSPGGTTARGVAALEEYGVRSALAHAMRAAAARSHELEEQ